MKRMMLAALVMLLPMTAQAQWKPDRAVEIIAGTEPGGAGDRAARMLQDIATKMKLVPANISVINKPGQGQRVAIAYMNQHQGDGHFIQIVTASTASTSIITSMPKLTDEMVPIIKLFDTDLVFAVKKDSPFKTVKDVVDQMKKQPDSVSFAFSTSAGNSLHQAIIDLAKLAGNDFHKLRIVVNNSGTVTATQVAGGHVDVGLSSSGSAQALVDSGQLRYIGSIGGRLPTLPDVPSVDEQGINLKAPVWTMVFGPKGLKPDQVKYWEDVLTKVMQSDEAKKWVTDQNWKIETLKGATLVKDLEDEYVRMRAGLTELGLVK